MFFKDKKQLKIEIPKSKLTLNKHKSTSQIKTIRKQKSKTKPFLKLDHSHQSFKQKNIYQKGKYSPVATTISATKSKPSLRTQENGKKLNHCVSRQRISISQVSKQPSTKSDNNVQKKQIRYNINPVFNNVKSKKCLQLNERTNPLLSHSNYSSIKDFANTKKFKPQVTELSQFAKSTDFSKIKKKKNNYIKNFYKTSLQDKNCFCKKIQDSLVNGFDEESLKCKKKGNIDLNNRRDDMKFQEISGQKLQQVNIKNCPNLSKIRIKVQNFCNELNKPNKQKLLLITNSYQKILSQLYHRIDIQSQINDFPACQLSRIHTQNSQAKHFSHTIDSPHQNIVTVEDSSSDNSVLEGQQSQSEHWDSYLQCEDDEKENRSDNKIIGAVQKLDLGKIKNMNIKQYQDEFMDNQDVFSDSWKKEINEKKRF